MEYHGQSWLMGDSVVNGYPPYLMVTSNPAGKN